MNRHHVARGDVRAGLGEISMSNVPFCVVTQSVWQEAVRNRAVEFAKWREAIAIQHPTLFIDAS